MMKNSPWHRLVPVAGMALLAGCSGDIAGQADFEGSAGVVDDEGPVASVQQALSGCELEKLKVTPFAKEFQVGTDVHFRAVLKAGTCPKPRFVFYTREQNADGTWKAWGKQQGGTQPKFVWSPPAGSYQIKAFVRDKSDTVFTDAKKRFAIWYDATPCGQGWDCSSGTGGIGEGCDAFCTVDTGSYCANVAEGGTVCVHDQLCGDTTDCVGSTDCGDGYICAVDGCCGNGECLPLFCDARTGGASPNVRVDGPTSGPYGQNY